MTQTAATATAAAPGTGQKKGEALNLVDTSDGLSSDKAGAVNKDKLAAISDDEITAAFLEIDEINEKRQALNDKVAAIKSRLVDMGLPRNAIGAAYQRYKTNDDKLIKFDAAYAKILNAIGKGFQSDLFT